MNKTTTGWIIGVAALGAMLTLMSADIMNLDTWAAAKTPAFIGEALAHVGAVIAAFIGGKLIEQ